jgi:uncharacterized repeat protein (TIGR03803 family)
VKRDKLGVVVSTAAAIIVNLSLAGFASAQSKFKVLYSFSGGLDGGPRAGLVRDTVGNLYGTTKFGGPICQNPAGSCGLVFKLARNGDGTWTESVVYAFTGSPDGANPVAGLIFDQAGNLYGTTAFGGDLSCGEPGLGCGTVFKVDQTGILTVLHTFSGGADGVSPYAGLIRDTAGNLYGTTYLGGRRNSGTVFELDKDGNETVLHSFISGGGGGSGYYPQAGLIRDAAGNLYGTTNVGGPSFYGTVFKLRRDGNITVLHSFSSGEDGGAPYAGLIGDAAGNLYGTTYIGGVSGLGTVFKLDKDGNETVLQSFAGGADGSSPYTGLIRDPAGNLYGTTVYGGTSNRGTVFKLDKDGNETVLHSFSFATDGGYPYGGLIRDSAGHLYGTTTYGGAFDSGTAFELIP